MPKCRRPALAALELSDNRAAGAPLRRNIKARIATAKPVTKVPNPSAPQSNGQESQLKLEFQFKVLITTTLCGYWLNTDLQKVKT
jgi:hypothetical protein